MLLTADANHIVETLEERKHTHTQTPPTPPHPKIRDKLARLSYVV